MTEQIIVQLNPDVPPTGSDLGVVNAARKSFGRRSEWDIREVTRGDAGYRGPSYAKVLYTENVLKDKDKRLLEFLARGMTADDFEEFVASVPFPNTVSDTKDLIEMLWEWRNTPTHDTPFNHGFFSFEVKAPIFVARHLVKSEYLIMSEYSRRYITDDVEFYQPKVWRKAAADVKQGSSDEAVENVSQSYNEVWMTAFSEYNYMIDRGVAPEQARIVLPQSLMTSWTWSGTLGAFAKMCSLRLSKDTQYETRLVAQQVYEELKKQFPVSAPLLVEGVL